MTDDVEEIESAWGKYPGYRIDLLPCQMRAQVWFEDLLLAESDRAGLLTETRHVDRLYIPEGDVRWELFEANDHSTVCPFKGRAQYWTLTASDPPQENVVWAYPTPFEEVAGIAGQVCFYDEKLRVVLQETWPDGTVVSRPFPLWGDAAELVRLMDVRPAGENRFVAPEHGDSARNVVEGGQLLGEAIVAASKTVPDRRVTSLSMVFSKAARFDAPVDLSVKVLRRGRTFSTVEVRASQDDALNAVGLALLDAGSEDVIRHRAPMPDVAGPEEADPHTFGVAGREIRVVNGAYDPDPGRVEPPEIHAWVRFRDAPGGQHLHAALLAQSTTHWTIGAAMLPHAGFGEADAHTSLSTGVMTATVAFHDDVDVTDWLLYANTAIWAGRGLAQGDGHVYTRDGRLVASYTVQAMIRSFDRDAIAVGGAKSAM